MRKKKSAARRKEGKITSLAEVRKEIKTRNENDAQRYKKYYGVDHREARHYDLVIDTTGMKPQEVVEKILGYFKQL